MKVLIGVDKGTSATKTVVIDAENGTVIASAARRTPTLSTASGRHEEDMDGTWSCVAETIRESLGSLAPHAEVLAVGVCGHMGGLWCLDADGRPAGPAIGWTDSRAVSILEEWENQGLTPKIFDLGGNALIAGMPSVLYAWMARHQPEYLERVKTVFMAKDFVNYRLTGRITTDESDLSFVPCDIRRREPSAELFELMGIPGLMPLLPQAVSSDTVIGHVSADAAALTGLPEGTPVVAGLGDSVANAIGAGAYGAGQAVTVIGTSFMNAVATSTPVLEPAGVGFTYLMPEGRWQRVLSNTGGGTLGIDWYLRSLGRIDGNSIEAGEISLAELVEGPVAGVPPLSNGVTFLPYLGTAGATAPFVDPFARASFTGMTEKTTRHDLLRAILEGVAYSMRECYAVMPVEVHEIRMTGGGARSELWRQICADVMDRELGVPDVDESGAVGVAVAAGVGVGHFTDYAEGVARLVRNGTVQSPEPGRALAYGGGYAAYRRLRFAFSELWRARAVFLDFERTVA